MLFATPARPRRQNDQKCCSCAGQRERAKDVQLHTSAVQHVSVDFAYWSEQMDFSVSMYRQTPKSQRRVRLVRLFELLRLPRACGRSSSCCRCLVLGKVAVVPDVFGCCD